MKYQAILGSKALPGVGQITVPFPIPDSEYDHTIELLEDMGIGSPTAQDCQVDGLDSPYPILNRLTTQSVNVDELDYLAKRLDSFSEGENIKFEAMASKLNLSSIRDFINLTFCCQRATVITDFSDLERIGKVHALTVSGESMPVEAFERLDYRAVALDLIQRAPGMVTPYGVVYSNGMKLEQVYDGQHFPAYLHQTPQLMIELKSGADGENTGFLYLPCPEKQVERTLARAGCGQEGFRMEITMDDLPPQVSAVVSLTGDGLDEINELCRAVEPLNAEQREKLGAVVLLARPNYASEVRQLAENLDRFDFVPKPSNPDTDCALTELGYVAYHGSLTLEELMQEDPAEQYRQEMGGLA